MSNIYIEELESLFKLVIEKLKRDKVRQVELSTDEYWIIPSDEWANFKASPKPGVGSLFEDVEYLKKTLIENEIISYCDLDRLSAILRAISETQAPINFR